MSPVVSLILTTGMIVVIKDYLLHHERLTLKKTFAMLTVLEHGEGVAVKFHCKIRNVWSKN